jgi:hypothetical protein
MDTTPGVWDARRVAMLGSWGGSRRFAGALTVGVLALVLALAGIALGACGDDDDDGESEVSVAELPTSLPTGADLGLEQVNVAEWDDATDLVAGVGGDLVIGAGTDPSDLGTTIEDAGFQGAVGSDLGGPGLNVRIRAAQFVSEDGALQARDLLHDEDLKTPCPDACVVTPIEYELDEVPDSAAVHHVPTRADLPPGQSKVEAHHAEFVIGPRLYVVQMDGKPSPTFSADFDELMRTVYESASSAE